MRMRNDVDTVWVNLVKYFGMAPPAGTTQTELENWARPDTPHPARKNRPQLYALLISARSGTLAKHESDMVSIPGGEICLGTIQEFKALLNAQPTEPHRFSASPPRNDRTCSSNVDGDRRLEHGIQELNRRNFGNAPKGVWTKGRNFAG